MIIHKTDEEIELIRLSGDVLGRAHAEVAKCIKPGVKTSHLDKVAYEFISDHGGYPSFKGYKLKKSTPYPASLCISVNEVVVHGIPDEYELQDGDIVSIDCGVCLNGYHSDSAYTYAVGNISEEKERLLRVTLESLFKGLEMAVSGNRIGDISHAIQSHVEKAGFSVVRELVGHGVGKMLHEEPEVPNYGKRSTGPKMLEGMVIAIEPMVNMGKKNVLQEKDGWTIRTADRKPSAHFEHTVAIKKGKPDVLTTFKYIEEVVKVKNG
ncbi:MAG: type I methionyl aminopeptidase [Cytophagaceae bacterium]|nr:type I methionyl aminopeptidase [Cytophagaceae bacterium]MDW8456731.1 type I methionyl aminopeptidase [Cytophagaceae bacterium]